MHVCNYVCMYVCKYVYMSLSDFLSVSLSLSLFSECYECPSFSHKIVQLRNAVNSREEHLLRTRLRGALDLGIYGLGGIQGLRGFRVKGFRV